MEPLYGIIPYFGKEWTVIFKEEENSRETLSGYGDFPFNRFPNIPVINLENNNKVIEYLRIQNELKPREENSYLYKGTMKTFLSEVKALRIEILIGDENGNIRNLSYVCNY